MRRNEDRGAMSLREAAAYVGVSEKTIRAAIHSAGGEGSVPYLRARKLGSRYLIAVADLEEWLDSLPEA